MQTIKTTKYQYGKNTLLKRKDDKYFIMSSMRMRENTTTYNIYKSNKNGELLELLAEDLIGYWKIRNEIMEGKYETIYNRKPTNK